MVAVETEIKFCVDDLASLVARLESAGFHLETPRTFESNVLYDTPDRSMRARTEILRIRRYGGKWTLTHKRLPDNGPGEDRHKHRVETETQVTDGNALAEVFRSLGLVPAFRYEKWRSEWSDGEGHCVIAPQQRLTPPDMHAAGRPSSLIVTSRTTDAPYSGAIQRIHLQPTAMFVCILF